MKILIVDDEAPARRRLTRLLEKVAPGAEIVGFAASGLEALDAAARLGPDVLLLDVQMPELDGIAVARALGPGPRVIFVTAHDAHAVTAFELAAVDYLLKPVSAERLAVALARVQPSRPDRLPRTYLERLFVSERGRTMAVALADVERILAEDNYVRLCSVGGGEFLHRSTLQALVAVVDPARFTRISRSAIVRTDAIVSVTPVGHGDQEVRLASGATLTWSRSFRRA